ncbi:MAG: TonB-dependent receptor [Burkholderiaceae bacterium]
MKKVPATVSALLLAASSTVLAQQNGPSSPTPPDSTTTPEKSAAPAPSAPTSSARTAEPAKTDATKLEQVTVTTGQRNPKAVDKIPGAVTVITQEEIQHTLAETEDATAVLARTVPGYSESSQALSNTGENLRGRIALRLFDGIPQGSPLREGTRNATFTDMGVIGRIEVINGPSASEGIGAAGGIINYISKVPTKEGDEYSITTRYGTQFHDDSAVWKIGATFARKVENYDFLVAVSHVDRGMTYDGNGRRIGLNTSGSVADSKADNVFVKAGYNFGSDFAQRLQLSLSDFDIKGKGNYYLVDGDRATGTTNTSERGQPLGAKTEFNHFKQAALSYRNDELLGGSLAADVYYAEQAMRYPAENGDDRQDPLIAPLGTLIDQSEIRARKKGLRTSWSRQDLGVKGFELRAGLDLTQDVASQRLALTDRLWVPPLDYKSVAPFVQLSYDIGPVTLTSGFRHESGRLNVDDYTTTYYRNRVAVEGGTVDYKASLPNYGAIVRLPDGFSLFTSYSKGFTLPNVGIPLRNVNTPGRSVSQISDLQAVIVRNAEFGVNWRNRIASFSASSYHSQSALGTSLAIDPVTNDFILTRTPTKIRGIEFSGDLLVTSDVKVTALYSRIKGRSASTTNGPIDKDLGVLDVNPDKLGGTVAWKFLANADVTVGATKLYSRSINEGTSSEEKTRGYTLYDMSAGYDAGKYGKVSLGVENLTNKFYILSWSQVVGFRNYWAGRGRVVTSSYTLTF